MYWESDYLIKMCAKAKVILDYQCLYTYARKFPTFLLEQFFLSEDYSAVEDKIQKQKKIIRIQSDIL